MYNSRSKMSTPLTSDVHCFLTRLPHRVLISSVLSLGVTDSGFGHKQGVVT